MLELFSTGNVFFQPESSITYNGSVSSAVSNVDLFASETISSFIVPDYVTQFSVVCVGGGGAGSGVPYYTGRVRYQDYNAGTLLAHIGTARWRQIEDSSRSNPNNWQMTGGGDQYPYDIEYFAGGGGGGLSYTNNVACYPGEVFTVVAGHGGYGRYSSVDPSGTTYTVNLTTYGTAGQWGHYSALFRGTDLSNSNAIVCLATGGMGGAEMSPYFEGQSLGGNRAQTAVTIGGNTIIAVGTAYNQGGDGPQEGNTGPGGGGAGGYTGAGGQGAGAGTTKGQDGSGGAGGGGGSGYDGIYDSVFGYTFSYDYSGPHNYNDPTIYRNFVNFIMPGAGGGGVGLEGLGASGTGGDSATKSTYTTVDETRGNGTGIIINIPKWGSGGSGGTNGSNADSYSTYSEITTEQNYGSFPSLDNGGSGGSYGGGGGGPGWRIVETGSGTAVGCHGDGTDLYDGFIPAGMLDSPENSYYTIFTTSNSGTSSRGGNGGRGGVRIVWGINKFFPNNAA